MIVRCSQEGQPRRQSWTFLHILAWFPAQLKAQGMWNISGSSSYPRQDNWVLTALVPGRQAPIRTMPNPAERFCHLSEMAITHSSDFQNYVNQHKLLHFLQCVWWHNHKSKGNAFTSPEGLHYTIFPTGSLVLPPISSASWSERPEHRTRIRPACSLIYNAQTHSKIHPWFTSKELGHSDCTTAKSTLTAQNWTYSCLLTSLMFSSQLFCFARTKNCGFNTLKRLAKLCVMT